jgi:hypothetical protein
MEFLGHAGAAHHVPPFQHAHLHAGLGEVERADQAVVAAADDEGVVAVAHVLLSVEGQ